MYFYEFVVANRELLKLFYTIVIGLFCLAIVLRTHKLFKLSLHQGIRYFRNAFLFYGLAFISRYAFGAVLEFMHNPPAYASIIRIVFEFFLIMAGFFLLYSLLWKNLESNKRITSSLLNARVFLFYLLALVLSVLDFVWSTYYFMFFSQIIVFSFASGVGFAKYVSTEKKGFLKLYLVVMVLNLFVWIFNFIVASFLDWHKGGVMSIYILNVLIFLLFLCAVLKATKK